jgi:hypothetical protein
MLNIFSKIFSGGVFTETLQDMENGGPECAKYMSFGYKMIVNSIMVSNIYLTRL